MGASHEKKRKRGEEGSSKSRKKVSAQTPALPASIKVASVKTVKTCPPVIGTPSLPLVFAQMANIDLMISYNSWPMPARQCPIPSLLGTGFLHHHQEEQKVDTGANKSSPPLICA